MIRITSKVDGYRRCGVLHPARPTEYPDDRFSEQELAMLKADPILTVEVESSETETAEPATGVVGHLDPKTLENMKVAELEKLAADMGLKVPGKATKKQLIELIASEPVEASE
jgi:hypothetical protein